MSCYMTGCPNKAEHVVRSVEVKLPGHPRNVNVGDLNVCTPCFRKVRVGARTSIRDDVVTAALARRL